MKKNKLLYRVRGTFYRDHQQTDENIITFYKEFKNDDNTVSRRKAFSYFNSCIEVLLEGIGLEFENLIQTEKDLKQYYLSGKVEIHPIVGLELMENDTDKFIAISFSELEKPSYVTKTGIKFFDDEKIIHAFGYNTKELEKRIIKNLEIEKSITNDKR